MSTVVDLDGVTVSLGEIDVLSAVSLSVEDGEFLGLVGPNGAGKTTLLRTINGTLAPDSGTVTVDGQAVSERSAREQSRLVATVPQDTSVRFDLSVRDLVEMGRTPYRGRLQFGHSETDRDHVASALERTSLTDLEDRPIDAVSGGERQRAYVARALAQDTPVLVCDEPTASLDINHQVSVLELLAGLADDGRTVVAAIHDLTLAARFCDRLALLSDGNIQSLGTPETVLRDGALDDAFDTATAVTENPVTGSEVVTARTAADTDQKRTVHVLGGGRVGARVLSTLHDAGYSVSAGPLRDGDFALEATDALSIDAIRMGPASPSEETLTAARSRITDADVVVLADPTLGGDGWILDLAARSSRRVFVEERPLHERNYGDEAVAQRYEALSKEETVTTLAGLATAVETAVERPEVPADD